MTAWMKSMDRPREALVALVMFGVLLISVGVAAWLAAQYTTRPSEEAKKILAEVRRKGLRHYLPEDSVDARYAARSPTGDTLIWIVQRQWTPGGLLGRSDRRVGNVQTSLVEWRIDDKLASGDYRGQALTETGTYDTSIRQVGNTLHISQTGPRGVFQTQVPAPPNYLPEGTFPLVAWRIAQQGQRAMFSMIDDSTAFAGGRLNFTAVTMKPLADGAVQIQYGGLAPAVAIYRFDKQGDISEMNYPSGATYKLVRKTVQDAGAPPTRPQPKPSPMIEEDEDDATSVEALRVPGSSCSFPGPSRSTPRRSGGRASPS